MWSFLGLANYGVLGRTENKTRQPLMLHPSLSPWKWDNFERTVCSISQPWPGKPAICSHGDYLKKSYLYIPFWSHWLLVFLGSSSQCTSRSAIFASESISKIELLQNLSPTQLYSMLLWNHLLKELKKIFDPRTQYPHIILKVEFRFRSLLIINCV